MSFNSILFNIYQECPPQIIKRALKVIPCPHGPHSLTQWFLESVVPGPAASWHSVLEDFKLKIQFLYVVGLFKFLLFQGLFSLSLKGIYLCYLSCRIYQHKVVYNNHL